MKRWALVTVICDVVLEQEWLSCSEEGCLSYLERSCWCLDGFWRSNDQGRRAQVEDSTGDFPARSSPRHILPRQACGCIQECW
jgi:hypothetical protein